MATRKEIDGSAGVPQFYGKELRFKREEAGLTLEKLVDGSFYGITYLSEIEHGHRRMPLDLAQHVDRVLKTDGFFQRRCGDVRKAKRGAHAPSFAPVVEAETRARTITEWSSALIAGLLQTRPYAHAVIRSTHPLDTPEDIEAKIAARLQRAGLFDNPKKSEYWAILHESLVRHPIISPEEMAEQLEHIAALVAQPHRYADPAVERPDPALHRVAAPLHELRRRGTAALHRGPVPRPDRRRSVPRDAVQQGIRSVEGRRLAAGGVPRPDREGG